MMVRGQEHLMQVCELLSLDFIKASVAVQAPTTPAPSKAEKKGIARNDRLLAQLEAQETPISRE